MTRTKRLTFCCTCLLIIAVAGGCENTPSVAKPDETVTTDPKGDIGTGDTGAGGDTGSEIEIGDTDTDTDTGSEIETDSLTPGTDSQQTLDTETDTGLEPLQIISELPDGFTHADATDTDSGFGGFSVVGPADRNAVHEDDSVCANIIRVVMRDFVMAHSDFQDDWSTSAVKRQLGDDKKPVASDDNRSKIASEWYRNVEDVNMPFAVDLWLEPVGDTFVFDSAAFFPLDGFGFDESHSCCENNECEHNYHFTTEMHANFVYNGGEEFTFIGDDDVYVFINNQLVIDLGGVHDPKTGTVVLDDVAQEFSLQIGEVYPIDLFQAERQWCGSTFRIETTLDFSGCGIILPTDIVV